MSIIHINSQEQFQSEVLDYKWLAVVDFRAEWCGPCRMIGPELEKLAEENASNSVKVIKVNVDENQDLAQAFQVSSIPVVFFIKDWQVASNIIGANPKSVYQAEIDKLSSN